MFRGDVEEGLGERVRVPGPRNKKQIRQQNLTVAVMRRGAAE
jgi:hypothetical protein